MLQFFLTQILVSMVFVPEQMTIVLTIVEAHVQILLVIVILKLKYIYIIIIYVCIFDFYQISV